MTLDEPIMVAIKRSKAGKLIHSLFPPNRTNMYVNNPDKSKRTPVRPDDKWVMLIAPSNATTDQKMLSALNHGR
jgi:hypothetical protein